MDIDARINKQIRNQKTLLSLILIGLPISIILIYALEIDINKILFATLYLVLSHFINVHLHELGHLVFGKIAGYKLVSYRVGLLSIDLVNGKFKVRKKLRYGSVGLCAMVPTNEADLGFITFLSGGIIFNLLFGALSFLAFASLGFAKSFFFIYGTISIFSGIVNAVPMKPKTNLMTDGTILWKLILKSKGYEKIIHIHKVSSRVYNGKRPRDLKIKLDKEEKFDINYAQYITNKAIDENDLPTLLYCCEKFIELAGHISSYTLESINYIICYASCISKDIENAKDYYDRALANLQIDNSCRGLRVRAYYEYYVNDNYENAKELCEKGLDVIDKYIYKGYAIMEKDLLTRLKDQIQDIKQVL